MTASGAAPALVLVLLTVLVGSMPSMQAGANATLAGYWGHPLLAALTNTVVASLWMLACLLLMRVPIPDLRVTAAAPWWAWLGGVLGGTMVLSAIVLAPRLGATAYASAFIVGWVAASVVIDHFGLIGFREQPVNLWRVVGGGMVVTGMILVQTH